MTGCVIQLQLCVSNSACHFSGGIFNFRSRKKLEPPPFQYLLGVETKIPDEHPRPLHMEISLPPFPHRPSPSPGGKFNTYPTFIDNCCTLRSWISFRFCVGKRRLECSSISMLIVSIFAFWNFMQTFFLRRILRARRFLLRRVQITGKKGNHKVDLPASRLFL